jgi:hypothetical protein
LLKAARSARRRADSPPIVPWRTARRPPWSWLRSFWNLKRVIKLLGDEFVWAMITIVLWFSISFPSRELQWSIVSILISTVSVKLTFRITERGPYWDRSEIKTGFEDRRTLTAKAKRRPLPVEGFLEASSLNTFSSGCNTCDSTYAAHAPRNTITIQQTRLVSSLYRGDRATVRHGAPLAVPRA